MSAPIPMGSVALALAQAGMHVFPVWPGQKRPANKTGLKGATRNPKKIKSWWSRIPTANIGIATGPSGLVVIDCDAGKPWPGEGKAPMGVKAGDDVLLGIAEDAGIESSDWLWTTPSVVTPSGGLHLYFRAPAEGIVRSRTNVAPWVDVRASGGYVVGPFSRIKAGHYRPSGGWEQVVEVDVDADFQPVGIPTMSTISFVAPDLPGWLADLVVEKEKPTDAKVVSVLDQIRARLDRPGVSSTSAYALTALERELELVRSAVNGTRNETLNRSSFALGTLVGAGLLDETEVATELESAARAVGLEDDEIAKTMRSGLSKGKASPRQVTTT